MAFWSIFEEMIDDLGPGRAIKLIDQLSEGKIIDMLETGAVGEAIHEAKDVVKGIIDDSSSDE